MVISLSICSSIRRAMIWIFAPVLMALVAEKAAA